MPLLFVCARTGICVHVSVCVSERERERERESSVCVHTKLNRNRLLACGWQESDTHLGEIITEVE